MENAQFGESEEKDVEPGPGDDEDQDPDYQPPRDEVTADREENDHRERREIEDPGCVRERLCAQVARERVAVREDDQRRRDEPEQVQVVVAAANVVERSERCDPESRRRARGPHRVGHRIV